MAGRELRFGLSLARHWWTVQRFGLSPRKVVRRILNRSEPKILCVTIPKSGTHLLERALCLHPRLYRKLLPTIHEGNVSRYGGLFPLLQRLRSGQILIAHLPFTQRRKEAVLARGVRCLFLIRDPRDVLVSSQFHITSRRRNPLHQHAMASADLKGRMQVALHGVDSFGGLTRSLAGLSGWLESGALVVRHEELVGPEGGGDRQKQRGTLHSIFEYLGVPADDVLLDSIQRGVFSELSPTFRKGAIGGWKEIFGEKSDPEFEASLAEFVTRYGYRA